MGKTILILGVAAIAVSVSLAFLVVRGSMSVPSTESSVTTTTSASDEPQVVTKRDSIAVNHDRIISPAAASTDNKPFAEIRGLLESRARAGDATAASRLGVTLGVCNHYKPLSNSVLENLLVDMLASGVNLGAGAGSPTPAEALSLMRAGQAMLKRDCGNEPGPEEEGAEATALEWLERAASLGDTKSQAIYGSVLMSSHDTRSALVNADLLRVQKRTALDYLQRAYTQGEARALLEYSGHYADAGLLPSDPEASYAFMVAYLQTVEGLAINEEAARFLLAQRSRGLDAEAIKRAQEEGERIALCCGGVP